MIHCFHSQNAIPMQHGGAAVPFARAHGCQQRTPTAWMPIQWCRIPDSILGSCQLFCEVLANQEVEQIDFGSLHGVKSQG